MSTQSTTRTPIDNLRWLARVPVDAFTYRSLGYLLLAMPLGLAYFIVLVTGFALSLGLSILLIGPVIFGAMLLVVLAFAWFDGVLAEAILDADVQPNFPSTESLGTFLTELFLGRDTWLGLLFLGWKMVLGFVAFVLLTVGVAAGPGLVLTPLYYGEHVILRYGFGTVPIDTPARALGVAVLGILVAYATLLCVNLLGLLSRAIAEGMLQDGADEA